MNKGKLKNYAPKARREFIQAVTDRAAFYGLTKNKTVPMEEKGDFVFIAGQAFPKQVKNQRQALEERIAESSFDHVMEEIAYTWFNRFVAIRYMELHGYLSHGYRVLSHPEPESSIPEIVEKAQYVELPRLDKQRVIELKMDGTKDEELYRMLLIAQCNELNKAMSFLFESIRDCTELLLPDNLLHSDSLIRKLVNDIDEADWQQVEIIGWMYQFYISEKKDEVIGSVVKSEDIPAATQLFTPNWIVKYLVQNSLGTQWMRTYPDSSLKSKMEYYIEPAQQTEEVQKQLKEITPDSLNPEELTILDPAAGSGHILVEAYDLLKEIYLERGYRKKDIPELILEKNLFGLEIDDRAAQLAGFAVMMKARADDRGLFEKTIQLNIISIQESNILNTKEIIPVISKGILATKENGSVPKPSGLARLQDEIETPLFVTDQSKKSNNSDHEDYSELELWKGDKISDKFRSLFNNFENAKTFGSLIRISNDVAKNLTELKQAVCDAVAKNNIKPFHVKIVMPFIRQAMIMADRYDAVVTNPPYMGSNNFNSELRTGLEKEYKVTRTDLYAIFLERSFDYATDKGFVAMITMQSWMFTSSYVQLREKLINDYQIITLAQLGARAFDTISGEIVSTAMFSFQNIDPVKFSSSFIRLVDSDTYDKKIGFHCNQLRFNFCQIDFRRIIGSPMVYWKGLKLIKLYEQFPVVGDFALFREGVHTGNNAKYLRYWWEIAFKRLGLNEYSYNTIDSNGVKWIPYNKGGGCFRWYGNFEYVIAFDTESRQEMSILKGHVRPSESLYFKEGGTWSDIGTSGFGVKYYPRGFLFDAKGPVCVGDNIEILIAGLNSRPFTYLCELLMPTISYKCGTVKTIPYPEKIDAEVIGPISSSTISIARTSWDSYENSWDFAHLTLLNNASTLVNSFGKYLRSCQEMTFKMKKLEEENNRLFIDAYGLQDELTPDVPDEQITLFANPKYRYGGNLSDEELGKRFREDTVKELISYSVGCMMGRYSLDEPGLIYAHAGNEGFDPSKYRQFPADNDGIIPITDTPWFSDDVAERFSKFIETIWGKETLDENLEFVAESIRQKTSESSREAIRRYFSNDFFKDHLKRYKKRPIYWLFSSGKEKAFQCLVYLHRYNEGTLSRMRTEYLIPLQGMIRQRIEHLKDDEKQAESASSKTKIRKNLSELEKQAEELRIFDVGLNSEDCKLRYYADLKIKLDLDDGVKVNYGKFGDLLAEVKAITGEKED